MQIAAPNTAPNLLLKGLVAPRRDVPNWIKIILSTLIQHIIEGRSFYECITYITGQIIKLLNNEVPINDLVITKTLFAAYATNTHPMQVFADRMAKQGIILDTDQTYQIIMIDRRKESIFDGQDEEDIEEDSDKDYTVGSRMMLASLYQSELQSEFGNPDEDRNTIDYMYYIGHLLKYKVDNIISTAFEVFDNQSVDSKRVITKPIKTLCHMLSNGKSMEDYVNYVKENCNSVRRINHNAN